LEIHLETPRESGYEKGRYVGLSAHSSDVTTALFLAAIKTGPVVTIGRRFVANPPM
jgi:hypothetical protein